MNGFIESYIKKIIENRVKILDDFLNAYIAERCTEKGWNPSRIKFVEQRMSDGTIKYRFEQQKGRSKKQILST